MARVLIVEDNRNLAHGLRTNLEFEGHRAEIASDGEAGLREVAELPEEEALERLMLRTRRYAAYQRKWLRRIPGLVSVNADRPVGEIAHEIVEVARTRQRIPAGRAG